MNILRQHSVGIVIIATLSLAVTFINLGFAKQFVGDDASVSSHFSDTHFEMASNMWESYSFPGRPNVIASTGLIHIKILNSLHSIGIPPLYTDRILFFVVLFLSGLGLYFLANRIVFKVFSGASNNKIIKLAILAGAIFYMMNNFTMILLSFPPTSYIYSYVLLPWVFLFYLKDFHISSSIWRRLLFSLLFLLLLSGNPSNTIIIVAMLLFYELLFRTENKIVQNKRNFLLTLLTIVLLSSYIILPTLFNAGNPYGSISTKEVSSSIDFNSTNTSLLNLFRFRGHPAQENYVFNDFLASNLSVISNYALLLFALISFLKKKITKLEIFLFAVFFIFLFLAKSEHEPFSFVNKIMYDKIPLFGMYRASYYKFIYCAVFAFSLLLPIGLIGLYAKMKAIHTPRIISRIILSLPFIAIILGSYPFLKGDVATDFHKTKVPEEYYRLNSYFKDVKGNFSILSLPQQQSGLTLDWGDGNYYASGAHPDYFFSGKPVWSNGWFMPENIVSTDLSFYKKWLPKTNVKYLLVHKDIPEQYSFDVGIKGAPMGRTNYQKLKKQIDADPDFSLIQDTKYFNLYEINNQSRQILGTSGKTMVSDATFKKALKDKSVTFSEDSIIYYSLPDELSYLNQAIPELDLSQDQIPRVEYRKLSPAKYRLIIHGAKEEFPLLFKESFQQGWKLYQSDINVYDQLKHQDLTDYVIFKNNESLQAPEDSIKDYLSQGALSTLGDQKKKIVKKSTWQSPTKREIAIEEYSIDFISNSYGGTIQNNNLPGGNLFETMFLTEVGKGSHFLADGYANSWTISPSGVCEGSDLCKMNPNGSYEIELVLEFLPQRFFHLGLAIAGLTLVIMLIAGFLQINLKAYK